MGRVKGIYDIMNFSWHLCLAETVMKKLAGNEVFGYVDGDLASAKFNKPKSFAVDLSGNLYVADHRNHAIRKITKSGVYIKDMFKKTIDSFACLQTHIIVSVSRRPMKPESV